MNQSFTMNQGAETVTTKSLRQRKHERFVVKAPAILRLPQTPGATYLITVIEASKTGLRISSPVTLPAGTQVEVRVLGSTVLGTAKYARGVENEFYIGIEADTVDPPIEGAQGEEFDLTLLFLTVGAPRRT
jgi:hypothetical protein